MAINLQNLQSSLTLNTAQFHAAASAAQSAISNFGQTASRELGGMTKTLLKVATGIPALAATATALGGIVAAAGAAGLAAGAFGAAVKPQMAEVTKAADAAAAAEEAHSVATRKKNEAQALASKGGKEYKTALGEAKSAAEAAAEADAALERQLKGMPAATQETGKAVAGLKADFKSWSDSLAGDTMPVMTKGIGVLRDLLPSLTPFVKAAAAAFSGALDRISVGIKGAGFQTWIKDMSAAAGPALTSFITVLGNLGRGFAYLLQAFLPASQGTTGGLVTMTAAFAAWAQSLKGSEGFAKFLESARNGASMLGNLGSALVALAIALAPLISSTVLLADAFARLITAIPTPVLTALALVLVTIGTAMKLWAIYSALAATATTAWTAAVAVFNLVLAANPLILVTLLIVALVAAVVVAYRESETFRAIVQAVWAAVQSGVATAVEGIKSTINWFAEMPGKVGAWFGEMKAAAIAKSTDLVVWLAGLPGRVVGALSDLGSSIGRKTREAFGEMRTAAEQKSTELVIWIAGLPGRITGAIGNLGRTLYNAGASVIQGLIDGVSDKIGALTSKLSFVTNLIPDWKGPAERDRKLLTPAGRSIMDGLMRGIDTRLPNLRTQLQGITASIAPSLTATIPTSSSITASYAGSAAPSRTIAPTINLYGSDATTGGVSRELAWFGKVG